MENEAFRQRARKFIEKLPVYLQLDIFDPHHRRIAAHRLRWRVGSDGLLLEVTRLEAAPTSSAPPSRGSMSVC